MRIRTLNNKSGSTVVQVGYDRGKNFILHKHIGSAKNDSELEILYSIAQQLLEKDKNSLFPESSRTPTPEFIRLDKLIPLGYTHNYAYQSLKQYYSKVFQLSNDYLRDLVIMRLIQPSSKLESIEYLKEYFSINYSKSDLHRKVSGLLKLQDEIFKSVISYASQYLNFKFQFVLYDVTTLYFETHLTDEQKEALNISGENIELRQHGFSKDSKPELPQILIGLIVDPNGFPIYYQIFEGNKFEGHTILPIILDFKDKFKVKELTIVADSGMLSQENLIQIEQAGLYYIVGGRIKQETITTLECVSQELNDTDEQITIRAKDGRKTIYHFSKKRYQKDKYEFEKQLKRAQKIIENPTLGKKKLKFVTTTDQTLKLNQTMLIKSKLALGIKSYLTNNLNLDDQTVIQAYHTLWQVEKAFRMSKSDLDIRPVFHRKKEAIEAHVLIVFTALVVAKVIELEQKVSIKKYVKEIMKVLEFRLKDEITGKVYSYQTKPRYSQS